MRVSVFGLGKLGAPLSAVLASTGHFVVSVDTNPTAVALVNQGEPPVEETGLRDLMARCRGKLTATTDAAAAVMASDVTFVIVPTPSRPDGAFSLEYVLSAVEAIGRALRSKAGRHVVVITSTVMPGATSGPIAEALERTSGLRVGQEVGLCYSPEFIALGSVIHDMTHPDFCLIGESDERAGAVLEEALRSIVGEGIPMMRMGLINAELAKISVNTFVTTKISFANMLAEICEQLPGADVDVVTNAIGLDRRIGRRYLQAATGYGGPCFPRDNRALTALAHGLGARADIAQATDAVNERQADRLVARVTELAPSGGRIAVLGLSYKPNTQVTEKSTGIGLAQALVRVGFTVAVYDPAASEEARRALGAQVEYAETATACIAGADVTVITTAWPQFSELSAADFATARRAFVIDCWRVLEPDRLGDDVSILQLGRPAEVRQSM